MIILSVHIRTAVLLERFTRSHPQQSMPARQVGILPSYRHSNSMVNRSNCRKLVKDKYFLLMVDNR